MLDGAAVQTRRLQVLVELARRGSMREVADALATTTSTVSQQIAALAAEVGAALVEPDGRRVRLTPEGRRLSEHAVAVLAAVEAARAALNPGAEPAGTVRVAGFATAIRKSLLPVAASLADSHPRVRLLIHEHEPADAAQLLVRDDVDLALTYDFDLAPRASDPATTSTPLWSTSWGLGVPADATAAPAGDALSTFGHFRDAHWIVNSRNTADERVITTVASMAGFAPSITHQADSLDLVQDLVLAGLGVGLLPVGHPTAPGVLVLPLHDPAVILRAYALTRRGRARWPPLELVVGLLTAGAHGQ